MHYDDFKAVFMERVARSGLRPVGRPVERLELDTYRIVETTQTYLGDIIDWVDPKTVPGSQIEPPPAPTMEEMDLPEGVELQLTELDLYPELRGPEGTIPMVRPTFINYVLEETGAESLEEYIATHLAPGQPAGTRRLYAGYSKSAANTVVLSSVNEFGGTIEAATFSVTETATVCRGTNPTTDMELVGGAVGRDRAVFGDSVARLRVEFLTAGEAQGDDIGGWDGVVTGFVAAAGRPYGPNVALPVSSVGGTQVESRFEIYLFHGNWWVAHNTNWLGYYPGSFFNLINASGCEAAWYGEVFDPTPTDWTWTNMGSGNYAASGYGQSAYFRNPYYVDTAGVSRWPDRASHMLPYDEACYTKSPMTVGSGDWGRYFFLGGPGGDAPGCD